MNTYTIQALMQANDEFLYKCLLLLYDKQTDVEQTVEESIEENGVGFNSRDAVVLSQCAESVRNNFPLTLSTKQVLRRKMNKYATQLTNYLTEEDLLL